MLAFRIYLIAVLVALSGYTIVTISQDGWMLYPQFFGDLAAMNWPGQFNADFMGFLGLSALWTMWRHKFSAGGIVLGVIAFNGGMIFLTIYLLIIGSKANWNMRDVLLGEQAGETA